MTTYKDCKNHEWIVRIDVRNLKKIRERVKNKNGESIDLLDAGNALFLNALLSDPVLLTDILWILVENQAREDGLTMEAFQIAHRGNVLLEAQRTLAEALAEFFPTLEGLTFLEVLKSQEKRKTGALKELRKNLGTEEETPGESGT